jgi:PAT family beta-lactamase induction signal transducer AmpG
VIAFQNDGSYAYRPCCLAALGVGVIGGLFTLSLLLWSRTPGTYTLAVLGENVVQSTEIACSLAIAFEIMGKDNPLAATNYAFLSAAYNVPIFYMALVDGWGYSKGSIAGEFGVDAAAGIAASLVMGALLILTGRSSSRTPLRSANRAI